MKSIASIFGQTISMSAGCGNVTQVMSRYLNLIGVRGIPLFAWTIKQSKSFIFGETN